MWSGIYNCEDHSLFVNSLTQWDTCTMRSPNLLRGAKISVAFTMYADNINFEADMSGLKEILMC